MGRTIAVAICKELQRIKEFANATKLGHSMLMEPLDTFSLPIPDPRIQCGHLDKLAGEEEISRRHTFQSIYSVLILQLHLLKFLFWLLLFGLLCIRFRAGCSAEFTLGRSNHEELGVGVVDEFGFQGYPAQVSKFFLDTVVMLVILIVYGIWMLTVQDTPDSSGVSRKTDPGIWGSWTAQSSFHDRGDRDPFGYRQFPRERSRYRQDATIASRT